MALSTNGSLNMDAAKTELITGEFFMNSLYTILESRIPFFGNCSRSPSSSFSSYHCSNLAPEGPSLSEAMEQWRHTMAGPLVVEILHGQSRPQDQMFMVFPKTQSSISNEEIVERWILHHEQKRPSKRDFPIPTGRMPMDGKVRAGNFCEQGTSASAGYVAESSLTYKKTYKKTVILLRSLYCTARLLPAHRLLQRAKSSGSSRSLFIAYRVSFGHDCFRPHGAEMQSYRFEPIETSCGTISVSILYRPNGHNLACAMAEVSDSLLPQIITDYVRSPSSDPMKKHSYDSSVVSRSKTTLTNSAGSPAGAAFARRHSWSGFLPKVLHSPRSPLSPFRLTSSPAFSPSQSHTQCSPPIGPSYPQRYLLADHSTSPTTSPGHRLSAGASQGSTFQKTVSFDESKLSPSFSLSPPSPSTRIHDHLPHSGSAPVSIPRSSACRSATNHASERCSASPNRGSRPPISPSPNSRRSDSFRRTSGSLPTQHPISQGEWPLSRKYGSPKADDYPVASNLYYGPKLSKDGIDDAGNSQRMKFSPGGTPFSRSSSRKSCLEEDDFPCPFAYDEEGTEWTSRVNSSEERHSFSGSLESSSQAKTQRAAAVGVLVELLSSAKSLYAESEGMNDSPQKFRRPKYLSKEDEIHGPSTSSAGFQQGSTDSIHRTIADALDELKGYIEIKESLLNQSGSRVVKK